MDNEVRIKVKADNNTKLGFDGARHEADKFEKDSTRLGMSAGMTFGKNFGASLTTTISGAASSMGPILAGIGVAAAPLIAATLAGAIIGGAGIGGVVGGAMIASKDPRVMSAFKGLGSNINDSLKLDASVFVKPLLMGVSQVEAGFESIRPHIQSIFSSSAQFVQPLLEGLLQGTEGIARGIDALVRNAGPVIDAFSGAFAGLGNSVGDAFEAISGDSEDAAQAIGDIADAAGLAVESVGWLIRGLTEVSGVLHDVADAIVEAGRDVGVFNEQQGEMGTWTRHVSEGVAQQTAALKDLSDAMRAQTDPVFALIDAQEGLSDAQANYNKALKENGKDSPEAEAALRRLAEAGLDVQGAVGGLGDEFKGNLTPELRSAFRAAGLTESQIDGLGKQFREARKDGDRFAKKYQATVALAGYRGANGQLNGLLRDLENFDGRWTATMVTNYVKHGKPGTGGGLRTGGIKGAASGGPQTDLTWTGENGPELVDLPAGTTVHSAGDSQRMMKQAMSGGGTSGDIRLMVDVPNDNDASQFLAMMLSKYVRVMGGGNVQAALGRN